jgi:superkiller protein 3
MHITTEAHEVVYDLEFLHKFAKIFPISPLTDFIDDYCRWFHLPLPEPEEEAVPDAPSEAVDGETKAKTSKKPKYGRRRAGMNARERRKARRLAEKEGALSEDLDQEERDELMASMTVSPAYDPSSPGRNFWTSCPSRSLHIAS